MKKITLLFSILCLFALSATDLSARSVRDARHLDTNNNGVYEPGEVDPNQTYECGPCVCYCKVMRFCPQYYCVKRCYQEPYTVTKKHCRYRNEYYTKTYCKKVPEYYCTCETKCRKKYWTERKCCYKPVTYIVKRCIDNPCCDSSPCPCSNGHNGNGSDESEDNTSARNGSRGIRTASPVAMGEASSHNDWSSKGAPAASDQDEQIKSRLVNQYNNPYFLRHGGEVNVAVENGIVVLSGSVGSEADSIKAESLAKSLTGVKKVNNRLVIDKSLDQKS